MDENSTTPATRCPLSSREINLIWVLFAGCTVIFFQVHLGPARFGINLSPFDLVVPVVVGWCLLRGRVAWPHRSVWLVAIGLLAVSGVHTLVSFGVYDSVSQLWLVQGFLKLAAFITLVSLVVVLLRAEELRHPPFAAIVVVFVAAGLYLVIVRLLMVSGSIGTFIPLTNLMSGLVGMLFLLVVSAYQDGRSTRRLLVGLASVVTLAIAIMFSNKGFALVAVGFLAATMFTWRGARLERSTYGWRLAIALLVVLSAATAVVAVLQQFDLMPATTDTIGRSLSIRATLWSHAISIGNTAFPLGIGAGQIATTAGSIPILATEGHEIAHSTALTWFAEFGLLGLLLVGGVVVLIWRAAIGWPGALRLTFLLYLAVPLILHDGHGVRMVMLILALGIANALYRDKPAPRQTSRQADD